MFDLNLIYYNTINTWGCLISNSSEGLKVRPACSCFGRYSCSWCCCHYCYCYYFSSAPVSLHYRTVWRVPTACRQLTKVCFFSCTGKHLVLVTDPERAADQFAFDNPCFKGKCCISLTSVPDLKSLLRGGKIGKVGPRVILGYQWCWQHWSVWRIVFWIVILWVLTFRRKLLPPFAV